MGASFCHEELNRLEVVSKDSTPQISAHEPEIMEYEEACPLKESIIDDEVIEMVAKPDTVREEEGH